jgi:hypothetical protein
MVEEPVGPSNLTWDRIDCQTFDVAVMNVVFAY